MLLQGCCKQRVWFSCSWCHKISLSKRQLHYSPPHTPPNLCEGTQKRIHKSKARSPEGMLTSHLALTCCTVGLVIPSVRGQRMSEAESFPVFPKQPRITHIPSLSRTGCSRCFIQCAAKSRQLAPESNWLCSRNSHSFSFREPKHWKFYMFMTQLKQKNK